MAFKPPKIKTPEKTAEVILTLKARRVKQEDNSMPIIVSGTIARMFVSEDNTPAGREISRLKDILSPKDMKDIVNFMKSLFQSAETEL